MVNNAMLSGFELYPRWVLLLLRNELKVQLKAKCS